MELDLGDNNVIIIYLLHFFFFVSEYVLIYLTATNTYFSFFSLKLKYIDEDDFKVLRHLTNLHLNGNHLTAITNNLLMAQKSLEYLGKY